MSCALGFIWEFPTIRGTFFGGPYNRDPTIQATILGSHILGNSHLGFGFGLGFGVYGPRYGLGVQGLGLGVKKKGLFQSVPHGNTWPSIRILGMLLDYIWCYNSMKQRSV